MKILSRVSCDSLFFTFMFVSKATIFLTLDTGLISITIF